MKFYWLAFCILSSVCTLGSQDLHWEALCYGGQIPLRTEGLAQGDSGGDRRNEGALPVRRVIPRTSVSRSAPRPAAPVYARLNCRMPNPYRPGTPIGCAQLPPGEHTLELYDRGGRRVLSLPLSADRSLVLPADLPAETYLLKIRAAGRPVLCERLVVLPALR